jgi:hypothetical protein
LLKFLDAWVGGTSYLPFKWSGYAQPKAKELLAGSFRVGGMKMKWTYRVFGLAVAATCCLSAGERRVEDTKRAEEAKKPERSTSEAKRYDPNGQLKTSVEMRKAFDATNTKKSGKEVATPPKKTDGAPPAAPPSAPKRKDPKP